MQYDVIVIGGSYAGMAATLQLIRARRTVLVIDAGERRNRFASHSHGFLGQDGVAPGEIVANARRQLEAYPTLTWLEGRAEAVTGQLDEFTVTTSNGGSHRARRILVATGVADQLPAVDGLAERWGKSVFHCPYCHGYELDQGRIGILGASQISIHQAELLTDWGDVTLLVNGAAELSQEARSALERRGVTIEDATIDRIDGHADVAMADGRLLRFTGLFAATRSSPASPFAEAMGCALEETPMGMQIRTDAENKTSVAGVFACGDVARAPHSVSLAVGNGAMAGVHIHRSLLWPEPVASTQVEGRNR
ncbi:FAD-dependent pyridine nucleotide-disulphide oxidoreductase [Acidovorax delafieldii 2AN]|uniref:FAD-dependent pyridine nucleotide-disulphide oxidoreductase n=1 Tax=Acidovorax delafieldii 2AN TaxID=573060 RepID=C5T4Q3_ACIDE|nr:NAD(P)/FAD-dependent oxidoreductase [Acidovorax delafieldii]EER60546.1 FAD-dependent pyridine nucleotide-disulphide oxidoreductase [Acidovorax delafieldii 2AN]